MSQPPPILSDQGKTDADHLRLLSIFHFVVAGLAIFGLGFLLLHYYFMHTVFSNPDAWKIQKGGGLPPREIISIFKLFYFFFGVLIVTGGVGNLLSGFFIRKRKNRVYSLIVAGFNCLQFPFGTVLGVFTFVVLLRDSVREIYDARFSG